MQFVNDPKVFPPVGSGPGVLVGPRTRSGEAVLWEPGGDAEALVNFVGPNVLVNVGGQVYQRQQDGSLTPATFLAARLVVVKPPAGEPFFLDLTEMERTYARVDAVVEAIQTLEQSDQGVEQQEGDRAVPEAADAPAAKRPPGRPKGSTNKPKE